MGEFIFKSVTEVAELIRSGEATSTEIVKDHPDQIKKFNPQPDAVVILLEEPALTDVADCPSVYRSSAHTGANRICFILQNWSLVLRRALSKRRVMNKEK